MHTMHGPDRRDIHEWGCPREVGTLNPVQEVGLSPGIADLSILHQDGPEYEQENTNKNPEDTDNTLQEDDHIREEYPYTVPTKDEEDNPRYKTCNTCFIHSDYVLSSFSSIFSFQGDKDIDSLGFGQNPLYCGAYVAVSRQRVQGTLFGFFNCSIHLAEYLPGLQAFFP